MELHFILSNQNGKIFMSNIFSGRAIKAGFIAGTLDITAACIQTYIKVGKGSDAVLKYLASAVFGKDAYTS